MLNGLLDAAEKLWKSAERVAETARSEGAPLEELERAIQEADAAVHRCRCCLNAARYRLLRREEAKSCPTEAT